MRFIGDVVSDEVRTDDSLVRSAAIGEDLAGLVGRKNKALSHRNGALECPPGIGR